MKSEPSPNLKVTLPTSMVLGSIVTSSCSTFTHSTAPIPSGNSKISGSLKGSVVNQPFFFSKSVGGLRHSSIVVQIENEGAKISFPSSSVTLRFPPSFTDTSSISLNR